MNREPEIGPEDDAAIDAFMRAIAAAPAPAGWSLPPADVALRQAQWRRRWEGERRMHVPLDVVVPLQIAAGLGAFAILMFRAVSVLAVTLHQHFA
jgi:hypothetical protein